MTFRPCWGAAASEGHDQWLRGDGLSVVQGGDGEDVENLISFTETGSHFRMVGMDKVRVSVQHGSV